MIKKVALYCRVSTAEQTNENQSIRLVEYCESKNYVYDIFTETESSRKTRPVKQELMKRLRAGEYSAVIVFKLDRFARSSAELILDISELLKKGIGFISLSDNLDFTTASGKLHFQILCAFAEFERELIRERTMEGLNRAKSQGKRLGRPKGSKDKSSRARSGYVLREAKKRKGADESKGVFSSIESYINNPPPK
jgi:DNA invertase Pin-like site-specific DNA recombinase